MIVHDADSLDATLAQLTPRGATRRACVPLSAARRARYKRVEAVVEFYAPSLAAAFNSRRAEVDDDDAPPPSSSAPTGFPALEALLWPRPIPAQRDSARRLLAAEEEGFDRQHIDLPADQLALIDAVAAYNDRVVVVLSNGSAVAVDGWRDRVSAILEGWLLGQAGAGAIADLLFGPAAPSGRLAETIPRRLADTPAYLNSPGERGRSATARGCSSATATTTPSSWTSATRSATA